MWINEHNVHPSLTPGQTGYLTLVEIPGIPDRHELRADPNMGVALSVSGICSTDTVLGQARITRQASNGRYCVRRVTG